MDGKKALELRVENLAAELQKAKGQAGDAEASTQQLQVCFLAPAGMLLLAMCALLCLVLASMTCIPK